MTVIPTGVISQHHTIADVFIDELGVTLTLVYPPIASECSNCIIDVQTGRSTGIYKSGGPHTFTNYTVCPRCGGDGRTTAASTENITVRWYPNPRKFGEMPMTANNTDGLVKIIGYISDLPKVKRASSYQYGMGGMSERYLMEGEPIAHGLTRTRYFEMLLRRV